MRCKKLHDLKATRQADINALITAKLDALVEANNNFAEQVEAYKQLYLEEKPSKKSPKPYQDRKF